MAGCSIPSFTQVPAAPDARCLRVDIIISAVTRKCVRAASDNSLPVIASLRTAPSCLATS